MLCASLFTDEINNDTLSRVLSEIAQPSNFERVDSSGDKNQGEYSIEDALIISELKGKLGNRMKALIGSNVPQGGASGNGREAKDGSA